MKPETIYNLYSPIYSYFNQFIYQTPIRERVSAMNLRAGQTVLSVACGTGDGFTQIMDKIGKKGVLVGIDASTGMLRQAQKLADENDWNNVHLIKCDAANPPINEILKHLKGELQFDVVTSQLGLSVIPNWKQAVQHMLRLLKVKGKLTVMDWRTSSANWLKPIVDFFARSDTSRPICEEIRKYKPNYQCNHNHLCGNVFTGVC